MFEVYNDVCLLQEELLLLLLLRGVCTDGFGFAAAQQQPQPLHCTV